MTEKDLLWEANDLVTRGIFGIQQNIEDFKAQLKGINGAFDYYERQESADPDDVKRLFSKEHSAIHGLEAARKELEIFEYMQSLLDQERDQAASIETVNDYLTKVRIRDKSKKL